MTPGILVLGKANVTLGALLDQDEETPRIVFMIAHANRTSERAVLDVEAAAALSEWLARIVKNPEALKTKKKGSE